MTAFTTHLDLVALRLRQARPISASKTTDSHDRGLLVADFVGPTGTWLMRNTAGAEASQAPFRPTGRVERWLWVAVLLMALAHAATTLLSTSSTLPAWAGSGLYDGAFVGAAVLCAMRARRQPGQRWAWLALAASLMLNVLGDAYYALMLADDPTPASPSPADWLWLSFFPAAYLGLALFLRATVTRFRVTMWLDALIVALGVAAFGYAVAFGHLLEATDSSVPTALTNLAYPLGDLLLIMLVVGAAAFGDVVHRMWGLLALGFVSFAAADTWYALEAGAGTYDEGSPMNFLWPLGATLVGLAAVSRPPTVGTHRGRPWWHVTVLPVVVSTASLALLGWAEQDDVPGGAALLAISSLAVGVVRAVVSFWEVARFAESRIQARTDELTGLLNRRGFTLGLRSTLKARGPEGAVAVLLIDLDRFKEINDALGHAVGDRLLALIGPRLQECLRPHDLVARLGGDEFAIVLAGDGDAQTAVATAERIGHALTRPFDLPDITLHVGASVGIALSPAHGDDGPDLLRKADVAMYDAKGSGDAHRMYEPNRDAHSRDRLKTIEQLRGAIEAEQLQLHYQPKIDLLRGDILGVEALVRWRHPKRGLLLPDDFLPLAEQSGLMRPLTDHVLDTALAQLQVWRSEGWNIGVAVNVSASNLLDVAMPERVARQLAHHGIPAHRLCLEITESTIMADPARAREVVQNLHDLGVHVSVDDYGTGYSSLAYLRHLSVRELKLDRDFVKDVCRDSRASAIVRSTVDLAHSLGLHMVAEGVEDAESARKLAEYGCDVAQGFHYSRPVSAVDMTAWLTDHEENRTLPAAG